MDIRKYVVDDYDVINEWWQEHGSFAPDKHHLPKNGIIVYDVENIAAGFLYNTDSSICVFEFVICNPNVSKEKRDEGLDLLIKGAIEWAENNEYSLIYTSIGIQKYIQRLKDNDFIEADNNQTHMFRGIE